MPIACGHHSLNLAHPPPSPAASSLFRLQWILREGEQRGDSGNVADVLRLVGGEAEPILLCTDLDDTLVLAPAHTTHAHTHNKHLNTPTHTLAHTQGHIPLSRHCCQCTHTHTHTHTHAHTHRAARRTKHECSSNSMSEVSLCHWRLERTHTEHMQHRRPPLPRPRMWTVSFRCVAACCSVL